MANQVPSTAHLLKYLRTLMASPSHNVSAYIVPPGDAHQSEYIAGCDKRRAFISKFTGSAGTAVITVDKAALWTDGRYHLQAEKQMDLTCWQVMKDGLADTPTQGDWLGQVLPSGSRVGVDPCLLSEDTWSQLSKELKSNDIKLVALEENLVDLVWSYKSVLVAPHDESRPPAPCNPVIKLEMEIVGESWQDKVTFLRGELAKRKCEAIVLTALDDVAYLFNLRGTDVDYNPVFFSYAVVTMDNIHLFVDKNKLSDDILDFLNAQTTTNQINGATMHVNIEPYDSIFAFIAAHLTKLQGKVWISRRSSHAVFSGVPKQKIHASPSPITAKKAIKNEVEIANITYCHVRDAAALCNYLMWIEQRVQDKQQGDLYEIAAADYLKNCRKQQPKYMGLSFSTISASGKNGSIIHYMANEETNKKITTDEIYLVDSGAQYLDGTTDVTRTIHLGQPTPYERKCFTLVLKGHIQLALTVFPRLVKGVSLDSFARRALWAEGLDYLHGTGHGVGMYLNVHEGPSGISFRGYPDDTGLQEGMVLSNEPGYYEDGVFGIRIENLVVVKKANPANNFKNRGYLEFDTITLVPIQRKMIDVSLLTKEELQWLNRYHAIVRSKVGEYLDKTGKTDVKQWLIRETEEIVDSSE